MGVNLGMSTSNRCKHSLCLAKEECARAQCYKHSCRCFLKLEGFLQFYNYTAICGHRGCRKSRRSGFESCQGMLLRIYIFIDC
jgi:hypothetical protein